MGMQPRTLGIPKLEYDTDIYAVLGIAKNADKLVCASQTWENPNPNPLARGHGAIDIGQFWVNSAGMIVNHAFLVCQSIGGFCCGSQNYTRTVIVKFSCQTPRMGKHPILLRDFLPVNWISYSFGLYPSWSRPPYWLSKPPGPNP